MSGGGGGGGGSGSGRRCKEMRAIGVFNWVVVRMVAMRL